MMMAMKGICVLSILASTALAFSPHSSSFLVHPTRRGTRASPQQQQHHYHHQVLVLKKSSVNQQDSIGVSPLPPTLTPTTTTTTTTDPAVAAAAAADDPLEQAKQSLLAHLIAGEDDNSPTLIPYLTIMKEAYTASKVDARISKDPYYNGDWKNINTPAFPGRLGFSDHGGDGGDKNGLPTYTIGTLTFGLIPDAKNIVCAVKQMRQTVHFANQRAVLPSASDIPDALLEAVQSNPKELRTNQIDTVFEIPDSNNVVVKGILRMEGYTIPSLDEENKYDTWFVGGRCIAQEGVDVEKWNQVFGEACMEYVLAKPVTAFQTVVFLDDDFRISIGNRGSVMIVGRENV